MSIENYLKNVLPQNYFLGEVLQPDHPNFSQMPGMFAVRLISVSMCSMQDPVSWYNVGDIILVDGFRNIFTEQHFGTDASIVNWNHCVTNELQHTIRNLERDDYAEVGEAIHPAGLTETTGESLQRIAARRILEEGRALYATISSHSVFGKVLQEGS